MKSDICQYANNDINNIIADKVIINYDNTSGKSNDRVDTVPYKKISPYFEGRIMELEKLAQMVSQQRTISIWGLGGMGKTQLILKYIQKYCGNKNEIIGWIDSENLATINKSFFEIYKELNNNDVDSEQQYVEVVLNYLKQSDNWLLIFDGADDQDLQIHNFFPENLQGNIIITSRHNNWHGIATNFELEELDNEVSIEIINKSTANRIEDKTDEADISELANTLQGLPLAIEHATAFIDDNCKVKDYISLYKKSSQKAFSTDVYNYPDFLYTTWDVTINKISSMESGVISILNYASLLHTDKIPLYLFDDYLECKGTANECLRILKRYSFFHINDQCISIHGLVQAITLDKVMLSGGEKEIKKIYRHLLSNVPENSHTIDNKRKRDELLIHIVSLYNRIKDRQIIAKSDLINTIYQISTIFYESKDYVSCIKYASEAIELGNDNEHNPVLVLCYNVLGLSYVYLSECDKANKMLHSGYNYIQSIFNNLEKITDVDMRFIEIKEIIIGSLIIFYKNIGELEESEKYETERRQFDEMLKTNGIIRCLEVELNSKLNTINLLKKKKDYDKALEECTVIKDKSFNIYPVTYAKSLGTMSEIYIELLFENKLNEEYYDEAMLLAKEAKKIFFDFGNKQSLLTIYSSIGRLYMYKQNFKKAKKYFKKSFDIARKIGSREGMAKALFNIGCATEDLDKRLEIFGSALIEAKNTGNSSLIMEMENFIEKLKLT